MLLYAQATASFCGDLLAHGRAASQQPLIAANSCFSQYFMDITIKAIKAPSGESMAMLCCNWILFPAIKASGSKTRWLTVGAGIAIFCRAQVIAGMPIHSTIKYIAKIATVENSRFIVRHHYMLLKYSTVR